MERDARFPDGCFVDLFNGGAGRVIAFDGGLYAVERDDCPHNQVTWHEADEMIPE